MRNLPIGKYLVNEKIITPEQLEKAIALQKQNPEKKLGDILLEQKLITEKQLINALSENLSVPIADLSLIPKFEDPTLYISEDLARKYNVIPYGVDNNNLVVALSDPMNFYAQEDIKIYSGKNVIPMLAGKRAIKDLIDVLYSTKKAEQAAINMNNEFNLGALNSITDETESKIQSAPVVKFVNTMIQQAVNMDASDIHVEPMEKDTRVRMRIDGELIEQMRINSAAHASLVTRIKIMSGLDIAERRIPQDGRIEMQLDQKMVDLRISILPTVNGEKVVIRILGGKGAALSRDMLGLTEKNNQLLESILKNTYGVLLVSGPTGSGKTTTIYSILKEFNKPNINIITVEDPVEYRLNGINQVQVNNKAGLTFASGLRSILRQDPNVIMVGEIRDGETAQIAVRAAITGHFVLSTIHTNDAASTVSRLVDMGIDRYLVSSAVVGVVAQRLVKKLCPRCKQEHLTTEAECKQLNISTPVKIYKPKGCPQCNNTGYKGRCAIHEIIVMNKEMRELLDRGATVDELRAASKHGGTETLAQSCSKLVLQGITSLEEMLTVTYSI